MNVTRRVLMLAMTSLAASASAAEPPEALSDQARAAVAPVDEALEVARRGCGRQKPEGVADKLTCLGRLDQAGRDVFQALDLSSPPPGQREAASAAAWREIEEQDREDRTALLGLMPPTGWFTRSAYGPEVSEAAWSVVMLLDRVRMLEGRPQAYGSRFKCVDRRRVLYRLEDPEHVEERRRAIGMTRTERQVQETIDGYPPCWFR